MNSKNIFMKKKSKLITVLILAFLVTSCDPIHYINFINNTDSTAKIKLNLNPKVENYDLQQIATKDSIVFYLKQKDTARIDFGIGDWSGNEIGKLTSSLKSIEIETRDINTIYKSKKAMNTILENNRYGFGFKTEIKIEIN